MRTPAEIETLLRVMRSQGCPELQEPDLLLKVRVSAKDIRPVGEPLLPVPTLAEEKRPQSYDPERPPWTDGDEDVDPSEIEPDEEAEAENFLHKVAKAAETRRKGRR